jgi:HEAT repeat protein
MCKRELVGIVTLYACILATAPTCLGQGDAEVDANASRLDGLTLLLESKDAQVREGAATALGETGSPRAVPPLVKALSDEEERVQTAVVRALGELGRPEAIAPLADLLRDESSLATEATMALAKLNHPKATEALIWALRHGDNGMVNCAAGGLAKFGAVAVGPLVEALDGRAEMRDSAAWALTQIADAKATRAIKAALRNKDWRIRLTMIRNATHMVPLPEAPWSDFLDPAKERIEIRRAALAVLIRHRGADALKALVTAADDPDPKIRKRILGVLTGRGDVPGVREIMIRALDNNDLEVRRIAVQHFESRAAQKDLPALSVALLRETDGRSLNSLAEAVAGLKSEGANDALAGFLERKMPDGLKKRDRHYFEQALQYATAYLAKRKDPRAAKGVTRLLNSSDPHTVRRALYSLHPLKSDDVTAILLKAAKHDEPVIRRAAFEVLAESKPKGAGVLEVLLAGARDENPDIRRPALNGLIGQKDAACVPVFKVALTSDDEGIRRAGYFGLARSGRPEALPPLAKILKDRNFDGHLYILRDLARSCNPAALDMWVKMLAASSDFQWRTQAAQALGLLGDRRGIEPLKKAMVEDSYPDVRKQAVYALVRVDEKIGYEPMLQRLSKSQGGLLLVKAIKATGEKGYLTALRKVVGQENQDGDALRLAMANLRTFKDKQAIPIIARHLNHPDVGIARAAHSELRWLGAAEEEIKKMRKELASEDETPSDEQ